MELWDRLLTLLRMLRGHGLRHYDLNERLQTALVDRAGREGRAADEIQAELVAAGLEHLYTADKLMAYWEALSPREKDITAFTCLGYTNKEIGKRLSVSPNTVKAYVRNALIKWELHDKAELRLLLAEWDFSAWGPKAQG